MPGLLPTSHLLSFLVGKAEPSPKLCYISGPTRGNLLISPLKSKLYIYRKPRLPTKQEVIRAVASGCIPGAVVGMQYSWNIGFLVLFLFRG